MCATVHSLHCIQPLVMSSILSLRRNDCTGAATCMELFTNLYITVREITTFLVGDTVLMSAIWKWWWHGRLHYLRQTSSEAMIDDSCQLYRFDTLANQSRFTALFIYDKSCSAVSVVIHIPSVCATVGF